jgi:PTS system mannose-specific IID component
VPAPQVERLKNALIATLGSVGDRLVWAGWLPLCSAIGLALTASASPLVGTAVFLVTYNVVHLLVRWWGLRVGWRDGVHVAAALSGPLMQVALRAVGRGAPFAVGLALPITAEWLTRGAPPAALPGMGLAALTALILGRWLAPALGGARIGLALLGAAFVGGLLWR